MVRLWGGDKPSRCVVCTVVVRALMYARVRCHVLQAIAEAYPSFGALISAFERAKHT